VCARRRSNFLLRRQEKVTKEKATPLPVSPSPVARGQPAMLGPGVCRRTRCVLRTPLKQLRQARQRCACPSARAHPRPCASRHGQKGVGAGSTRAIASLGPLRLRCARLARATAPAVSAARIARVTDPRRSCAAAAVWTPLPTPAGCAEKRRSWGGRVCRRTHTLRDLACRSCLSGVRRTQRVHRHHPRSEHRRLPPFARQGERGTQTGGRLLFGDFLLAAKRKLLRRRAHTPASALGKSTQQPQIQNGTGAHTHHARHARTALQAAAANSLRYTSGEGRPPWPARSDNQARQ
jgi:hypothetical protein